MKTRVWSAMDSGEVRKKKAKVMWKREIEVIIVEAEMIAMFDVDVDALQYDNPIDVIWVFEYRVLYRRR